MGWIKMCFFKTNNTASGRGKSNNRLITDMCRLIYKSRRSLSGQSMKTNIINY